MTIKSFKTLLAAGLMFGLISPAIAEDVDDSSNSQYALAYNKCTDAADNQEGQDWDNAFNNCMINEGFEPETENYEETESYQ